MGLVYPISHRAFTPKSISLISAITASSMNTPDSIVKALGSLNLVDSNQAGVNLKKRRASRRSKRKKPNAGSLSQAASIPSRPRVLVPKTRRYLMGRANRYYRISTTEARLNISPTKPVSSALDQRQGLASAATSHISSISPIPQSTTVTTKEQAQGLSTKCGVKSFNDDALQHLPAPTPTATYLFLARAPTKVLTMPQPLLLVLDLNGTLLYRPRTATSYRPRPSLQQFLRYCIANHKVLIWSSAMPHNVVTICKGLFTSKQLKMLLGIWGRDTLELTPEQYATRVQVYKRLDRIWTNPAYALKHPLVRSGVRWCQKNTLLLDDSVLKASSQPYNLVEIPEYKKEGSEDGKDVLGQVTAYLEEARTWDNVSSFVRERRFEIDKGWVWNWDSQQRVFESISSDDEEGGVRLDE